MNQTHLHLLISHLPIFGSVLGALVLLYGIWKKNRHTIMAAYYVLLISSIGAVIVYLTGEAAEETVENIQGVAEQAVEAHEDFAQVAFISLIILGLASLAGMLVNLKRPALTGSLAKIILLISLVSFGLVARTGYLGGMIRHTELGNNNAGQNQNHGGNEENGHDDD